MHEEGYMERACKAINQERRMRTLTQVVLALLLAIYISFFLRSVLRPETVSPRQKCLKRPTVFSHRAAVEGYNPGSLGAAENLSGEGICAFDVDCFKTRDGTLVIGHPIEIQQRLKLNVSPEALTLTDLRATDMGSTATARDFMCHAARRTSSCPASQMRESTLRLLIEPKGSSISHETVEELSVAVRECGLDYHEVGIWVIDPHLAAFIQGTGVLTPLAPVKGSNDQESPGEAFKAIGPSIANPELPSLAKVAKERQQAFYPWVVDTREHLDLALELSADGVISNYPVWLTREVEQACGA